MHILEMQAAYGRLRGDSLRLEPGLNLIYAPNESGKSTWCSFIRTMLYGLPTRQSGPLADKNRFSPWTGEAMQGRMDLETDGRRRPVLRATGGKRPDPGRDSAGRTPGGIPAQRVHRPERPGRQPGPGAGAPDRRPAVHGTGGRVLFRKL